MITPVEQMERRVEPDEWFGLKPDDLLSMLLNAKDEVTTLFDAGHEATSNALSWSLDLLAATSEDQEEAWDPASLRCVFGGLCVKLAVRNSRRLAVRSVRCKERLSLCWL